MMRIRSARICSSLLVLGALSCGSQIKGDVAEPVVVESGPAGPTGVETITETELRDHVAELSSDAYNGRETLKPGYERAAKYLIDRFTDYGLQPLPGQQNFSVGYTVQRQTYVADKTTAELTVAGATLPLVLGADFTPFSFSDQGEAEAEIVFAGYGITADDLDYDDYAGLDVKGKYVLVLRHTPNEDDEKSKFKETSHGLFLNKAMAAQNHGAIGMILVTDPRHHKEKADDLRVRGSIRLPATPEELESRKKLMARREAIIAQRKKKAEAEQKKGKKTRRASKGRKGKKDAKAAQQHTGSFLAVHASRDIVAALAATSGKTLEEIQIAIDGGTPASQITISGTAKLSITEEKESVDFVANNIIGMIEGSDPALKDEWIVIGAHFDHLGGFKGTGDTVFNGADDNASGTSGVLELAQAFATRAEKPKRSIVFIGFSGEEKGLLGSRALLREQKLPVDKILFMLNLDMIGRNADKPVEVVGDGYATRLKEITEKANIDIALPLEFGGLDYAGNSDHHPFFAHDIPVMFFFTGLHDDYHQLTDHADQLAYPRMRQIVRLAYGVIDEMATGAVTPRFIHQILWLGAEVQVVDHSGKSRAVVTAVTADSRAERAGIAKGDVITGFADNALTNPREVGEKFRALEPGTKTELQLSRAGTAITVNIERAKRGYLGVFPRGVDEDTRRKLGLADNEGVLIAGLTKDGPAGKAGIEEKDILIRISGLPVGTRTLGRSLARIGAGEKVNIVVVRDGKRVTLELVLGERPEPP